MKKGFLIGINIILLLCFVIIANSQQSDTNKGPKAVQSDKVIRLIDDQGNIKEEISLKEEKHFVERQIHNKKNLKGLYINGV